MTKYYKSLKEYTTEELKKEIRRLRKIKRKANDILFKVENGTNGSQIKAATKWLDEYGEY
jgi:hypothetical protein